MAKTRKKKEEEEQEQEQEKAYEVKDKRSVTPEGTNKEDVVEETKAQQAPPEEVKAEAPPEETKAKAIPEEPKAEAPPEEARAEAPEEEEAGLPLPDVYSTLGFMVGMLAEQAWRFMGIRLAPGQKEMAKDLVQAKIAIDTLVFISDKLDPHISDDERGAMRDLISNLQINFVQQNK